jgi:4-diphosphocytidyl-2-C-methyl-D-erythritol kinase
MADEVTVSLNGRDECEVVMVGMEEQIPLEKNLCYKAWLAMKKQWPDQVKGVRIEVRKSIPAGAGLAGGSSDAAGVMRALRELFNLEASREMLAVLSTELGADVPFFHYEGPMFAEGIGEILTPWPLDLGGFDLSICTSNLHSSTPEAFTALDWGVLNPGTDLREILQMPVTEWKTHLRNDLEGPVFGKFPELKARKEQAYSEGAIYASMTGSGSSIFALFPEK